MESDPPRHEPPSPMRTNNQPIGNKLCVAFRSNYRADRPKGIIVSHDVETTVFTMSDSAPPPMPQAEVDRRDGDRHMTLYRVGALTIGERRELCLIKNISAGGMMVRAYCSIPVGTPLSIELKVGDPVRGRVSWVREPNIGIVFDQPLDVIELLAQSIDGPRPRMPRVAADCHATLREGAHVHRVSVVDVSQGGVKLACHAVVNAGEDVVVTLPGLAPVAGISCWAEGGRIGVTFNRLLPLQTLVGWLHTQRDGMRSAS